MKRTKKTTALLIAIFGIASGCGDGANSRKKSISPGEKKVTPRNTANNTDENTISSENSTTQGACIEKICDDLKIIHQKECGTWDNGCNEKIECGCPTNSFSCNSQGICEDTGTSKKCWFEGTKEWMGQGAVIDVPLADGCFICNKNGKWEDHNSVRECKNPTSPDSQKTECWSKVQNKWVKLGTIIANPDLDKCYICENSGGWAEHSDILPNGECESK